MGTSASTALWFLPFVVPLAIWVAWSDLSTMKIPNRAVIAMLLVYLVVGVIALPLPDYGTRMLHFVVILVIGFILSAVNMIGAGDAKFAAAMAPFIALQDMTIFIALFAICVILGFVTHRLAKMTPPIRKLTANWESWTRKRDFPMGYPLAGSLVTYLIFAAIN